MSVFALDQRSENDFAAEREIRMNMQVGVNSSVPFLVLAGRLAIRFDEPLRERLEQVSSILKSPRTEFDERWRNWADKPDNSITLEPISNTEAVNALFTIFTGFPPPPPPASPPPPIPPAAPPHIYGHLPFQQLTGAEDVYYRYESFPTSRRINQATGEIAPGTYAAPASELFFMPTGLSAVARQALPSLMPASWRWELQPIAGTLIRYGASVPLYGQSGGGVEVRFEPQPHTPNSHAQNRGPIANPVMLPDL